MHHTFCKQYHFQLVSASTKKIINAIREVQLKCLGIVKEETWAKRLEEEGPGLETVLDIQERSYQGVE